jgi:hypothetical protein
MADNARLVAMWEDNPNTPITAANLSETIDFKSSGKFFSLANEKDDYINWLSVQNNDYSTGIASYYFEEDWPNIENPELQDISKVGKTFYNFTDNSARKIKQEQTFGEWKNIWDTNIQTPFKKILTIKSNIVISSYYNNIKDDRLYASTFNSGLKDQNISYDDLLVASGEKLFKPNKKYFIYLYVKYSYNKAGYIKIVSEEDSEKTFWQSEGASLGSPTGNNIISYKKIGGFDTNNNSEIKQDSIWDLYTYRELVVTNNLQIMDNGNIRTLNAKDFDVSDEGHLFNNSSVSLTVEEAVKQSQSQIRAMSKSSYLNRRAGVNLQFSFVLPANGSYSYINMNRLTLRITPGFLDIGLTAIEIEDYIYLASSTQFIYINNSTGTISNPVFSQFKTAENVNSSIYPGIWRVFLDSKKNITLKEESEGGGAFYQYKGWYDKTGEKRCIGKFRVSKTSNSIFIEKLSVVNTFDISAPIDSIHLINSVLVPDGLLLCDGRWWDVTGQDLNSYNFNSENELYRPPPITAWKTSWYEETPNYIDKMLRGFDTKFGIEPIEYKTALNEGNNEDYLKKGGSEEHTHTHEHYHNATGIIIPDNIDGVHDHSFSTTGTTSVRVPTTTDEINGKLVSIAEHSHNFMPDMGKHGHSKIQGTTAQPFEDDERHTSSVSTSPSNFVPSYRNVLICIKKI